jgi:hypothetical protein
MSREDAKELVIEVLTSNGVGRFSAAVIAAQIVDVLGEGAGE